MKTRSFGLILATAMLVLLSTALIVSGAAAGPAKALVANDTSAAQQGEAIIIDHTCTDLSQIPDYWLEQAQTQLDIFYGHTSHGSQPVSGMYVLGIPIPPLYEYGDDLGHNGDTSWMQPTRNYLDAHPETNVIVWSWCGGVSGNDQEGINIYLNAMNQLEMDYPDVAFVYMTGHLDGGGVEGNLNQRNSQIRAFCMANDKILFDFADIESYDPDEDEFLSRYALDTCYYDGDGDGNPWNDGTNWAVEWCDEHSADPLCEYCDCAHSESLNCNLKGRAFWWMMARLAGWSGPDERTSQKMASTQSAVHRQTITYTLIVQNLTAPVTATVHVTDEVPAGLAYVPSSLSATSGSPDDSAAPTLRWTGELTPTPVVTITYVVTVNESASMLITNTAAIAAPNYDSLDRSASVLINRHQFYLPLVVKGNAP